MHSSGKKQEPPKGLSQRKIGYLEGKIKAITGRDTIPNIPKAFWDKAPEFVELVEGMSDLSKYPSIYGCGKDILLSFVTEVEQNGKPDDKVLDMVQRASNLFLKEKELDGLKKQLEGIGGPLILSKTDGIMVGIPKRIGDLKLKVRQVEKRTNEIDAAVAEAQKELSLSRLSANSPLKKLYEAAKSSRKKLIEINKIKGSIDNGFFEKTREFLYEQIALAEDKQNPAAIANYLKLLQSIEKLADSLQEFDPEKYDNLEVKSYCSSEKTPSDIVSKIFTKAKGILDGSITSIDKVLEEIGVETDKVSVFMQQIKETQASLVCLQLGIEKIPEPEKALFQKKFEEQRLIIEKLKSDDSDLQQKNKEIQEVLKRLETAGELTVKLLGSESSETPNIVEPDEESVELLKDLYNILEKPDASVDASLLKITEKINIIVAERIEAERQRKEEEMLDRTKKALRAIDLVEAKFLEASKELDEVLLITVSEEKLDKAELEREKLVDILKEITDIISDSASVLEQDEDNQVADTDELQKARQRIKELEEKAQKLVEKIDKLEVGAKDRERREREAPKKAQAYAKLACAINAVNKALRDKYYVGAKRFEKYYQTEIIKKRLKIAKVEEGENKDVWSIFNALLQRENIRQLSFNDKGRAEIAVEVYSNVFKVTIQKATDSTGATIQGAYDVQLQKYFQDATDVVKLGPEFFKTPIRINKRGNLLVATDKETNTKIVRDQYIDYDHQVTAMLKTQGLEMDETGEIHPIANISPPPPPPPYHPQLIVAGTGSGKSGIIATTAMVRGRGIFATQPELVGGMVRDVNDFVKKEDGSPIAVGLPSEDPDNPGQPLSEEYVAKFLDDHPYVAMSHDQLILYSGILKDQNIFIDEVHSVVPKSYERDYEEKMAVLNSIVSNNRVIGTTATPTNQVIDLLGTPNPFPPPSKKPIYELTLEEAQKVLKTVREIKVYPEELPIEEDQLANEAVKKLLTRHAELTKEMRGYDYKDKAKNTRLSSCTQGLVFTDDAQTAREIHNLLSGLKDNNKLCGTLNSEASRQRSAEEADVYKEMTETQRKIIESNIKIDIIVNLGVSTKTRKDLQKLVRNGYFDELGTIYKDSAHTYQLMQRKKEGLIKSDQNQMENFCSTFDTTVKGLTNNMSRLRLDPDFNALYNAYLRAVRAEYNGDEPLDSMKRNQAIRDFREAVNNNDFKGLAKLCKKTTELKFYERNKLEKVNKNKGVNKCEEEVKSLFQKLLPSASALNTIMQDPNLIKEAEARTLSSLQDNDGYKKVLEIYKAALKKNHRNDEEGSKKEVVLKEAEEKFKELLGKIPKDTKDFAALKQMYNEEVRKSYTTDWKYNREIGNAPALGNYYSGLEAYSKANTEEQDAIVDKLMEESSISALLLEEPKDEEAIKRVKALQAKGLIMHVVSTGPMGTGHSDPNLLSTVVVQKHSIADISPDKNPVIKAVQEDGRPIRDDDGIAFGSDVTNKNISVDGRNLTFAQVYSKEATKYYLEKTQAFEDYWAPTMEKTKKFSIALENLKDTIKKLPIDKDKAQEVLGFINKFDIDVKVKVRAIDKKIQALNEKARDAMCSVEELNKSIAEITVDIEAIDIGVLIDGLKARQGEPLPNETLRILADVSSEVTKLQDGQAEKLKSLHVIPIIRASNVAADELEERIKQTEDKIQENTDANLKATELRGSLEELAPEKENIMNELEEEREKLENIKQEKYWEGLDGEIKSELEKALLRINSLLDTKVKSLSVGLDKIEDLAKARELANKEVEAQVAVAEEEIKKLVIDTEKVIVDIDAVLDDPDKNAKDTRGFVETTKITVTTISSKLDTQHGVLKQIKIEENLEEDLQEQIRTVQEQTAVLVEEKKKALTQGLDGLEVKANEIEQKDKQVADLIKANNEIVDPIDKEINALNIEVADIKKAIEENKEVNAEALDKMVGKIEKLVARVKPVLENRQELLDTVVITPSLALDVQEDLKKAKALVVKLQTNHLKHLDADFKALETSSEKRHAEEAEADKSVAQIELVSKNVQEKIVAIENALKDPNRKAAGLSVAVAETREFVAKSFRDLHGPSEHSKRVDLPAYIKKRIDNALDDVHSWLGGKLPVRLRALEEEAKKLQAVETIQNFARESNVRKLLAAVTKLIDSGKENIDTVITETADIFRDKDSDPSALNALAEKVKSDRATAAGNVQAQNESLEKLLVKAKEDQEHNQKFDPRLQAQINASLNKIGDLQVSLLKIKTQQENLVALVEERKVAEGKIDQNNIVITSIIESIRKKILDSSGKKLEVMSVVELKDLFDDVNKHIAKTTLDLNEAADSGKSDVTYLQKRSNTAISSAQLLEKDLAAARQNIENLIGVRAKKDEEAASKIQTVNDQVSGVEGSIKDVIGGTVFDEKTKVQDLIGLVENIQLEEKNAGISLTAQGESLGAIDKVGLKEEVASELEKAVARVGAVKKENLVVLANKREELSAIAQVRDSEDKKILDSIKNFGPLVEGFKSDLGTQVTKVQDTLKLPSKLEDLKTLEGSIKTFTEGKIVTLKQQQKSLEDSAPKSISVNAKSALDNAVVSASSAVEEQQNLINAELTNLTQAIQGRSKEDDRILKTIENFSVVANQLDERIKKVSVQVSSDSASMIAKSLDGLIQEINNCAVEKENLLKQRQEQGLELFSKEPLPPITLDKLKGVLDRVSKIETDAQLMVAGITKLEELKKQRLLEKESAEKILNNNKLEIENINQELQTNKDNISAAKVNIELKADELSGLANTSQDFITKADNILSQQQKSLEAAKKAILPGDIQEQLGNALKFVGDTTVALGEIKTAPEELEELAEARRFEDEKVAQLAQGFVKKIEQIKTDILELTNRAINQTTMSAEAIDTLIGDIGKLKRAAEATLQEHKQAIDIVPRNPLPLSIQQQLDSVLIQAQSVDLNGLIDVSGKLESALKERKAKDDEIAGEVVRSLTVIEQAKTSVLQKNTEIEEALLDPKKQAKDLETLVKNTKILEVDVRGVLEAQQKSLQVFKETQGLNADVQRNVISTLGKASTVLNSDLAKLTTAHTQNLEPFAKTQRENNEKISKLAIEFDGAVSKVEEGVGAIIKKTEHAENLTEIVLREKIQDIEKYKTEDVKKSSEDLETKLNNLQKLNDGKYIDTEVSDKVADAALHYQQMGSVLARLETEQARLEEIAKVQHKKDDEITRSAQNSENAVAIIENSIQEMSKEFLNIEKAPLDKLNVLLEKTKLVEEAAIKGLDVQKIAQDSLELEKMSLSLSDEAKRKITAVSKQQLNVKEQLVILKQQHEHLDKLIADRGRGLNLTTNLTLTLEKLQEAQKDIPLVAEKLKSSTGELIERCRQVLDKLQKLEPVFDLSDKTIVEAGQAISDLQRIKNLAVDEKLSELEAGLPKVTERANLRELMGNTLGSVRFSLQRLDLGKNFGAKLNGVQAILENIENQEKLGGKEILTARLKAAQEAIDGLSNVKIIKGLTKSASASLKNSKDIKEMGELADKLQSVASFKGIILELDTLKRDVEQLPEAPMPDSLRSFAEKSLKDIEDMLAKLKVNNHDFYTSLKNIRNGLVAVGALERLWPTATKLAEYINTLETTDIPGVEKTSVLGRSIDGLVTQYKSNLANLKTLDIDHLVLGNDRVAEAEQAIAKLSRVIEQASKYSELRSALKDNIPESLIQHVESRLEELHVLLQALDISDPGFDRQLGIITNGLKEVADKVPHLEKIKQLSEEDEKIKQGFATEIGKIEQSLQTVTEQQAILEKAKELGIKLKEYITGLGENIKLLGEELNSFTGNDGLDLVAKEYIGGLLKQRTEQQAEQQKRLEVLQDKIKHLENIPGLVVTEFSSSELNEDVKAIEQSLQEKKPEEARTQLESLQEKIEGSKEKVATNKNALKAELNNFQDDTEPNPSIRKYVDSLLEQRNKADDYLKSIEKQRVDLMVRLELQVQVSSSIENTNNAVKQIEIEVAKNSQQITNVLNAKITPAKDLDSLAEKITEFKNQADASLQQYPEKLQKLDAPEELKDDLEKAVLQVKDVQIKSTELAEQLTQLREAALTIHNEDTRISGLIGGYVDAIKQIESDVQGTQKVISNVKVDVATQARVLSDLLVKTIEPTVTKAIEDLLKQYNLLNDIQVSQNTDPAAKTSKENALQLVSSVRTTVLEDLIAVQKRITELAQARAKEDGEIEEAIKSCNQQIAVANKTVGELLSQAKSMRENPAKSKEQLELLVNTTKSGVEKSIQVLKDQQAALQTLLKEAPKSLNSDVRTQLDAAIINASKTIAEQTKALEAELVGIDLAIQSRKNKDDSIGELVAVLKDGITDVNQKIEAVKINQPATAEDAQKLEVEIQNIKNVIDGLQKQQEILKKEEGNVALPEALQTLLKNALAGAKEIQDTKLPEMEERLQDLKNVLPKMHEIESYR